MKEQLMKKMQEISPEEQSYLDGNISVKKDIYTSKNTFEIDRNYFLKEERLITVRPHSRFVEFPVHGHNFIEIMYVCKGTITHYLDGKELTMEKGDMLLLNQFVRHGVKKAGYDDIGINFIALPEFFAIPLQMLKEKNVMAEFLVNTLRRNNPVPHYLLFRLGEDQAIENLMENMIASMIYDKRNEDSINQYTMGIIFLYLLRHMECLGENSSQSYKDVVVQSTLNYIDIWYKNANLTKIAGDFHLSLSALSKMIRQSTGFTFQELLQRKRFQKAVMLLMESDLPVEEIAAAVGYENLSYFYRQFKSRYGMTPGKYRFEHKNDKEIRI